MLQFRIISSRIVDAVETEKKYVVYKIYQGGPDSDSEDYSIIERRYTHFLNLYNNLRKEYPTLMAGVNFPKKVVMGNFDEEVINGRAKCFRNFLEHIANETRLREASCTIYFFQDIELNEAKKFMKESKYDQALTLLESNFKLLNRMYMDRSRVVLIALCRLVACGAGGFEGVDKSAALAGPTEKWASLALRRFDAVSDADLLTLYVPLIQATISIWKVLGKESKQLEQSLDSMRRSGMKVDACPNLMGAIEQLEESNEFS